MGNNDHSLQVNTTIKKLSSLTRIIQGKTKNDQTQK